MDIKNTIKLELLGWKKHEIIILISVFFIILFNAMVLNDNIIAIISALCGVSYTIIAGKGKISCYLFGLIATACYSYLAYINNLYGNFILNIGYYMPMQIWGIFAWKKNLKKTTNEIIKTKLEKKELIKLSFIAIPACILTGFLLKQSQDLFPFIDSTITVLSIVGMYLTVKRCIEQWIVWIIVDLLAVIIWGILSIQGSHTISTFVMWFVYLLLGIYFYTQWKKEITN